MRLIFVVAADSIDYTYAGMVTFVWYIVLARVYQNPYTCKTCSTVEYG